MSSYARGQSPEVKLITLYNLNLPKSQSQQSFRVQNNTTVFDLINHLRKHNQNKEIELFFQPNQAFQGSLNSFLFPILQQWNIRTINYKVFGENSLTSTTKQPYQPEVVNIRSQYTYAPQNQSQQQIQVEQQNQSQFSPQSEYQMNNINKIGGIALPQQAQTSQQQILQLKSENVSLQKKITYEKEQNLELQKQIVEISKMYEDQIKQLQNQLQNELQQKLQQSQRELYEKLKYLNDQLENERTEKNELIRQITELKRSSQLSQKYTPKERQFNDVKEEFSPIKSQIGDKLGTYYSGERLSSTTINDQSRIKMILNCSHQYSKIDLEQILNYAMQSNRNALCSVCYKSIGFAICRKLGQAGLTYIDYKCKKDLQIISRQQEYKYDQTYLKCSNITCSFFCFNTPNLNIQQGYCPLCLGQTVKIPYNTQSMRVERPTTDPTKGSYLEQKSNIYQPTHSYNNQPNPGAHKKIFIQEVQQTPSILTSKPLYGKKY